MAKCLRCGNDGGNIPNDALYWLCSGCGRLNNPIGTEYKPDKLSISRGELERYERIEQAAKEALIMLQADCDRCDYYFLSVDDCSKNPRYCDVMTVRKNLADALGGGK
ncbi:MAG: hypothetical protein ABFC57_12825 [Veillonellales bacterium]